MIEVEFVRDYRGKLTREIFYRKGERAKFPADVAVQICRENAAKTTGGNKVVSLPELRERAKLAGIKGWHVMKRETLQERLNDDNS
jgi:hypothetical protein